MVAAGFSGITRTHYTLIFEMSDQQSLLTLPVNGEGVYGATNFWMLVTGKPAALRLADLLLRSLWYDVGRSDSSDFSHTGGDTAMEKDFFINAVQMVDVEGSTNIPTALLYQPGNKLLVGSAAVSEGSPDELNEDFKVDLGNIDPGSKKPRTPFFTATGTPKSAAELTADFLHEVVKYARTWMGGRGVTKATSVLLAEPVAQQDELLSGEWLSNYRNNLRRILIGKGFATIDFLPEPFAVFQYYRYGARHPLVAQRAKLNALVVDFGGGTCDVCIIETTKEGDISQTGRNSKPLAAASKPIGGFFINRITAEDLFRAILGQPSSTRLKKGLAAYMEWRRAPKELTTYADELRNFIRSFHTATHRVETPS